MLRILVINIFSKTKGKIPFVTNQFEKFRKSLVKRKGFEVFSSLSLLGVIVDQPLVQKKIDIGRKRALAGL